MSVNNGKTRVLVVDDEETIRKLVAGRLERDGWDVVTAANAAEAEAAYGTGATIGVMVTDVKMPGKDGFALTAWVKEKSARTKTIVVTGHGDKAAAIQAIRQGASDYLEKPFDMDMLSQTVKRCAREHDLENENSDLVARLEARIERVEGKAEDSFWYVSKAQSMAKVNEWLTVLRREAMRGNAEEPSVLILGESGTGKEGVARMAHAGSRRGKGPWVAVNCANFGEQLLESELFGHEKGSFTGATGMKRGLVEIARGGTLFLDEIGEMDVKLQAKLLRVLQEKTFRRVGGTTDMQADVRVIAATNRNLGERVKSGAFREDLFHRINRVTIEIPSLRERSEDIVPMATQFAERAFRARGKAFAGFSPDGAQAITAYAWPGNVRELLNVVERVALTWTGTGAVTGKSLMIATGAGGTAQGAFSGGAGGGTSTFAGTGPKLELVPNTGFGSPAENGVESYTDMKKKWSDSFEREYLLAILNRYGGNVSAASREAKLDRSNFLRLLRKHQIKAQVFRKGEAGHDEMAAPATGPSTATGTGESQAA